MIRRTAAPIRFAWAMLFAVLLMVRSLAPAGFMPAFDHGAVTIVACPDASPASAHDHHGADHRTLHQPCPYAAASALGALGPDWTPAIAAVFFAIALLLGRSFLSVDSQVGYEWPPSRGPPLLA